MQNKFIYLVIGLILLVLIVVAATVLPSQNSKNQQKTKEPEFITKHMYKDVVVTQSGTSPASVKINTGWVVRFINNNSLNLNVDINGKTNLILTGSDKTLYSPVFTQRGTYTFIDRKNPKISGEIVVEGAIMATSAPASAGQKAAESLPLGKEIVITDGGFTEKTINLKNNEYVHFLNSSSKNVSISSEGSGPILKGEVLAGEKSNSLGFEIPGKYIYKNTDNPSQKIEITVTER